MPRARAKSARSDSSSVRRSTHPIAPPKALVLGAERHVVVEVVVAPHRTTTSLKPLDSRRHIVAGETKVPSPLGAAPAKDQCERVGHLVAFGNTEAVAAPRDTWLPAPAACRRPGPRLPAASPPLTTRQARATSPSTGATRGRLLRRARYNKRNQVVPLMSDRRGPWRHRPPRRPVPALACPRRASCRKRGRDGTKYSRFHPTNYLSHHLAGIVTAAVFADAAHRDRRGNRSCCSNKTRVTAAAAADLTE
jgi:hypothetical protein